ncbi:MAG: ATP-binding cassette domain-containing protein, partial [Deltaproteobacteria bacterium]|nr:ATP-binding cassette domain-containing protein [Deltaproteobacteria bacterium]
DTLADPDHLRRRLGYLPQQIGAYPGISGRDLLDRFAWLKGRTDSAERRAEVEALLARVNLSDAAHRAVATYSGGMMRRFGIAMALIGSPRLLIVDEPTAGLDPAERNRFHRVLADVAEAAVVLLSTHIVEDVENLCARLAIMAKGRIVAEGAPGELTARLQDRLWSRVVPRGEDLPRAMRLTAAPEGTLAVVLAEDCPGPEFTPRRATLEDVYHAALADAGVTDEEA